MDFDLRSDKHHCKSQQNTGVNTQHLKGDMKQYNSYLNENHFYFNSFATQSRLYTLSLIVNYFTFQEQFDLLGYTQIVVGLT